MTICSFYQRGTCKYGDRCHNEHPGSNRDNRGGANSNRFGVFNNSGGDRYRPGQQSGGGYRGNSEPRFHLSKDDMKSDLTGQRPIYPLSCYGPGRDAPRQLIEGALEISPEELRLRYYMQRAAGQENAAQQEETALAAQMQQQIDKILADLDGAIKYVEDGADIHPNRLDIAQGKAPVTSSGANPFSQSQSANALGGTPQPQASAFGQPAAASAFGQPAAPSAFGQQRPATSFGPGQATFGAPAKLGASTGFGQPSMPGAAASAFGQPSGMGAASGFGQASALGGASPFGRPSMPGAAAAPGAGSAFGATNALGKAPGFGQPAFGAAPFGQGAKSAFGASGFPAANTGASPLAQIGQQQQQQPAFGAPGLAAPGPKPSPFGGQQQGSTSPFGQAAQQKPAFGASGFAAAAPGVSPFGAKPAGGSPWVQQAQTGANTAFGQASKLGLFRQAAAPGATSTFGQASAPGAQAQTQQPAQPAAAAATNANPFASVQQQQTQQQAAPAAPAAPTGLFGGQQQQAQAAPIPALAQIHAGGVQPLLSSANAADTSDPKNRFKEGNPKEYAGELGQALEDIYRRVGQLGRFNDDELVPETPPKVAWIVPVAPL